GTVYSTNLTPDAATGIGQWSFSAFQRAMREGISRDGRHLYPAFPYTSFTRMTDDDLTALYAYLMAQPAVAHQPPATKLAFPFNLRPLMAMWNALYLVPGPMQPEPARSAEWNRGAYLVNGPGHCGACHTPRNAFGAERIGAATLSGAMVDGWEAPALTALSTAPLPWTEGDLYGYLRRGYSPRHGVAGGPMAPVVQQLQALPDADIRAMAVYLASFNKAQATPPAAAAALAVPLPDARARLFEGACGACHHDTPVPGQFGLDLPLALNSNLHSARPDNLLRTILDGLQHPPTREVGYMPAFRHALDDRQIADIAAFLRQRHAPGQPAWPDLQAEVARLRQQPAH
ncbi:MAG: c-type cytochrome, partial [Aquincola tertiaricarbonis]